MPYLERKIKKYQNLQMLLITIVPIAGIFVGKYLPIENLLIAFGAGIVLGLISMEVLIWRDELVKEELNYIKGLKGENYIESLLQKMPSPFRYKRSIKMDYGNLDFLIIGNNGIFCIEVKNIGGKISYDEDSNNLLHNGMSFDKNYLKQVKGNAFQINKIIKDKLGEDIFIVPILVFSNRGAVIEHGPKLDSAYVLSADKLLNFLFDYKNSELSHEDQEKIYNLF